MGISDIPLGSLRMIIFSGCGLQTDSRHCQVFVEAPDTQIWLTSPAPAGFLRWEGPLAEPDDPTLRVDLLPGGKSEPAKPPKPAELH